MVSVLDVGIECCVRAILLLLRVLSRSTGIRPLLVVVHVILHLKPPNAAEAAVAILGFLSEEIRKNKIIVVELDGREPPGLGFSLLCSGRGGTGFATGRADDSGMKTSISVVVRLDELPDLFSLGDSDISKRFLLSSLPSTDTTDPLEMVLMSKLYLYLTIVNSF